MSELLQLKCVNDTSVPYFFKYTGFPQPGNLRLNVIYGTTIRGDLVWEVRDVLCSSLPAVHMSSTTWVLLHTRWQCFPQSFLLILSAVLILKFATGWLQQLFTLQIVKSCRIGCTTMLTASITGACACNIVNKYDE